MTRLDQELLPRVADGRDVEASERAAALPNQAGRRGALGVTTRYALAVFVALIFLLPLLFLANTALKTPQQFSADPVGVTHHLDVGNFTAAWRQGAFAALIRNSVLYTFVCAAISTALSLLVAFPISRGYVRWPRFWLGLFVVALFLPNALTTQFQLLLRLGLYDKRIGYMLILTAALGVGPLLITGYVRAIPRELDEAVAMDGAGYFRYLFQFIVPLCRPVLATVFILQAIIAWNEIIFATIFLPDPNKLPVMAGLFSFEGQYSTAWSMLAAGTLIVALPLVVIFLLLQRYLIAGALNGAFKA